MLRVGPNIAVPRRELLLTYARSSGPGGQNVNRVASKVTLRWNVAHTRSLPEDMRERFLRRFARRITGAGELVLSSQRHREQARNVEDCFGKLRAMLAAVELAPRRRTRTRPTRASIERRLTGKRERARRKRERRPRVDD
jgi:ribosome-associated protein